MPVPTARMARPYAHDPYRALFEHLPIAAAWCRQIVEDDQVVELEVLEANRAFAPMHAVIPELFGLLTELRCEDGPQTRALRVGERALMISVYPLDGDDLTLVIDDVTSRDELVRQARESQLRFEQAFHGNAAAMAIAHRPDLRIIDVNPRWLDMIGTTRAEVVGRTSLELGLITELAAQNRIAEHQQFVAGYDTELAVTTRTGAQLTVLASARPIELPEGNCTLTTLIDITGRKRAEQAFAAVFAASPAGMALIDAASDRVLDVNAKMLELVRRPRDELVGRSAGEIDMVASPPREVLLAEIQRDGRLDGAELELRRGDGSTIATLISTERLTLHGKEHRLSVFTDISARKQLERRLATKHAIGRSLAEYADIEEAIPEMLAALCTGEGWDCGAVWLRGDDGALTRRGAWRDPDLPLELELQTRDIELAYHGMLGRVVATSQAEKLAIDPQRGPLSSVVSAYGLTRAVAFPILRGDAVHGVVAMAARDAGPEIDASERGLYDSVGRLLGLFVERTRAQAELRELNIELERRVQQRTAALETSNRDLESFSSSVSHDLRAPLRAIHGFAEILLDDFAATLPAEAGDLVERIHTSSSRLRAMVEDLLAFSRLGRTRLRCEALDLDPMVRAVLDELLLGREVDRLALRVSPLGRCHADPGLIRAVWTNLIDNALKYSRDRDRVEIDIGAEQRGDETVYFVHDNGVGFDMAHADRLFGMFQRLHAATDFEGSGIGLANVRRIVERHGGRVAASSAPGTGTRFEFTLGATP